MSEDLTKIKRRISSISSTRKITNAMELVSSAKLRVKKRMMENVVEYSKMVEDIIFSCLKQTDITDSKLYSLTCQNTKTDKDLYVVITSTLGLCGGYNYNVCKYLSTLVKQDDEVIVIGSKGLSKVDRDVVKVEEEYSSLMDEFDYSKVKMLNRVLQNSYMEGKYRNIYLVYTHFKNSLTFIPTCYKIFPFVAENNGIVDIGYPPIYCPSQKEVLDLLIPKYINSVVFEKIAESLVSEEGSRRNAMESATDNADELNKQLKLVYNKARQAAITSEINEIMSGRLNKDDE